MLIHFVGLASPQAEKHLPVYCTAEQTGVPGLRLIPEFVSEVEEQVSCRPTRSPRQLCRILSTTPPCYHSAPNHLHSTLLCSPRRFLIKWRMQSGRSLQGAASFTTDMSSITSSAT